jgi:hypothetical protein
MEASETLDFHVPAMPNIINIPEPLPPRKIPSSGYDVKTLRRQVDFLTSELHDREEKHITLYRQNRQLWIYTQDLVESSRSNAHRMKTHVGKLHEELKHSHEIRQDLANKLITARDSKSLLKKIFKNIHNVKLDIDQVEYLCNDAEQNLNGARAENEILENSLCSKMERLQLIHWQIDENRNKEKSDALISIAEDFWLNSLAVLRSAYSRFKQGVGKRIRCTHLFTVLRRVYDRQLKLQHFQLFKFFVKKRKFMHGCRRRCTFKTAIDCLMKWKLFTAMEKFCKRSNRRKLLKNNFDRWVNDTRAYKRKMWTLDVTESFRTKQTILNVFRAWKQESLVLQWHSPRIKSLEITAIQYLKMKIMRCWLHEAQKEKLRELNKSRRVHNLSVQRLFETWRLSCKALWQRRGMLLLRFIRNSQDMVVKRAIIVKSVKRVDIARKIMKFSSALLKWSKFSSHKLRIKRKAIQLSSQNLFIHRKLLKVFLSNLQVAAATISRRQYCFEAAAVFDKRHMLLVGLKTWYKHASDDVKYRNKYRHKMYNQAMQAWYYFVYKRRNAKKVSHMVYSLVLRKQKEFHREIFNKLHRLTVHRSRAIRNAKMLQSKNSNKLMNSFFRVWRCKWTSILYWRMKETSIEAGRIKKLVQLKSEEIESLERNRTQLQIAVDEQDSKLNRLQTDLDDKEERLRDATSVLESRRLERKVTETDLAELRSQLALVSEERQQLQDVEQMLIEERERENLLLKERMEEAEALVDMLQKETSVLQLEVKNVKDEVIAAESTAVEMLSSEQIMLQESEETTETMENLVKSKEDEVQAMGEEHVVMQQELEKMQKRLNGVLKDGFADIQEAESQLRNRQSQARVTSNNANMIEARNAELQRILEEEEAAYLMLKNNATRIHEEREIDDTFSLARNVTDVHHRIDGLLNRLNI